MRFLSAAALLTALVSGINGSVIPEAHIGTFDTFTDTKCGHGGKGITVTDKNSQGTLSSDIHSVKAYIPGCACKCFYPDHCELFLYCSPMLTLLFQ